METPCGNQETEDVLLDGGTSVCDVEVKFRPQLSNNNSGDDSTDNETNFEAVVEKIEDRR